jgi:hypothetical protein
MFAAISCVFLNEIISVSRKICVDEHGDKAE